MLKFRRFVHLTVPVVKKPLNFFFGTPNLCHFYHSVVLLSVQIRKINRNFRPLLGEEGILPSNLRPPFSHHNFHRCSQL